MDHRRSFLALALIFALPIGLAFAVTGNITGFVTYAKF